MSRIELRYLLPEDYRWMFDKLGGGFFSVVRLRYKPLVVKGCQRHSFAIAGIQCYSTVISLYNKMWGQAKLLGYSQYPRVISYLADTWLRPYKERFITAWTDTCMHLGSNSSQRAESAHARVKKYLGVPPCHRSKHLLRA